MLGFGTLEIGPGGKAGISDAEADRLLNAVLDAGINFIDTSIDYGLSEERIGRFIGHRRSEYLLASKCGCIAGSSTHEHLETPGNVRGGIEHSLRKLRTDRLDLLQFHRSLPRSALEESGALEELLALKNEGKVRFIGTSGSLPYLVEQIGMPVFDVFQIPYSLLEREHEALIYLASGAGAGIVVRGGAARGLPSDWDGRSYYALPGATARDRWQAAHLDDLLDGMSRQEFTLRFTLSNPDLDTAIIGTKSLTHLAENVATALRGPLPPDVIAEAKRRTAAGTRSQTRESSANS